MTTQASGVVEQQAHELWSTVFHDHRDRLFAAAESVIRRCDSVLPMLPPSMLTEALTVSRWDRFVREEGLQPKRRGAPIEVIARRGRNALDVPSTRKIQLVVEAWLPEEDALRWVARAAQTAVFQWFNERQWLAYVVRRPPFARRDAESELECAYECALAFTRIILGDEHTERSCAQQDSRPRRARTLAQELREWRAPATDESDEARDRAQSREQVAYELAQSLEHVARGEGYAALGAYSSATNWCYSARIELPSDAPIVRRYYDVPDVEAWIANS